MKDEPDPPRVVYGFKPREFDRVNTTSPHASADAPPPAGHPTTPDSTERIDVIELNKLAAGDGPQIGIKSAAVKPTEIHAMLRENYQKDVAAGHYELGALDDSKRRRRIRNYWIAMVGVNVPLGAFAYWVGPYQYPPIPFVCAIAAMAILSAVMTWETFFLRTHY
ncbi:MAG: hypothetical protein RIQ79_746 [Verrucomicrobiota bacterium]|jgi:hypothetical protein